jgi:hypothetical protein
VDEDDFPKSEETVGGGSSYIVTAVIDAPVIIASPAYNRSIDCASDDNSMVGSPGYGKTTGHGGSCCSTGYRFSPLLLQPSKTVRTDEACVAEVVVPLLPPTGSQNRIIGNISQPPDIILTAGDIKTLPHVFGAGNNMHSVSYDCRDPMFDKFKGLSDYSTQTFPTIAASVDWPELRCWLLAVKSQVGSTVMSDTVLECAQAEYEIAQRQNRGAETCASLPRCPSSSATLVASPVDLHRCLTLTKIYAASCGDSIVSLEHWEWVCKLEQERKRRVACCFS